MIENRQHSKQFFQSRKLTLELPKDDIKRQSSDISAEKHSCWSEDDADVKDFIEDSDDSHSDKKEINRLSLAKDDFMIEKVATAEETDFFDQPL